MLVSLRTSERGIRLLQTKRVPLQSFPAYSDDVNSLTYQAGLYCDQAFKRDSIVATNVIGSFVGLLVMGIVGDRYGRFISMTVSLIVIILSALCTVVGGTHKLVPLLMAGQILMGFGIDSAEVTTYFFVIESSSKDFASRSIVKMNSIWYSCV